MFLSRYLLPAFIVILNCYLSAGVEVALKDGKLKCKEKEVLGKKVISCLGVPFAEPPIKDKRFRPPVQKTPWEGVKRATKQPNLCMQINPESFMNMKELKGKTMDYKMAEEVMKIMQERPVKGGLVAMGMEFAEMIDKQSEDCLYLNMFFVKDCKPGQKLAPLIFMHGGFFYAGGIGVPTLDGSILAAHSCLLVVVPQYRLNIYGFLNGGTPEIPGNMGLLDQWMACDFIKRNAESLGADPELLTVYGWDSGGWSAGFCMFSPICSKLVKRYIMSSGGPLAPIMLLGESAAFSRFEKFVAAAKCPLPKRKEGSEEHVQLTKECLDCLEKLTPKNISDAHNKVLSSKKDLPYIPNENLKQLGGNPFDIYKKYKYEHTKEIMITGNSNEFGVLIAAALYKFYPPLKGECQKLTLDQLMEKMKQMSGGLGGSQMAQMQMMLPMMFRSVDKNNPEEVRNRILSLASDGMYTCLDLKFAKGYCKHHGKKLYFLRFNIRPSKSYYAKWLKGSQHADEFQYIWGLPLDPQNADHYNAHEKMVSDKVMTFFGNFARHGNPAKGTGIAWHSMHGKKRSYLEITEKEIKEHKKVPKNCCADVDRYYEMGRSFLKNYKP